MRQDEGEGQDIRVSWDDHDGPLRSYIGNRYPRPFMIHSASNLVIDTHGQTQGRGLDGLGSCATTSPLTTTMASTLARVHPFHLIPRTSSYSILLPYSCRRRSMMSAWSSHSATATKTVSNAQPPLHDTPPIVIPTSNTPLSPNAASPQIAARPPPAPKATRPKPTLRPQKAALTLVNHHRSPTLSPPISDCFLFNYVDAQGS